MISADDNLEEVLGFIAGIANTIPKTIAMKDRPAFGHYLLKDDLCKLINRSHNNTPKEIRGHIE